ncbi:hypothetical protein B0H19DRAFT_1267133 [Mycena capillaripes]|nr:hypothetical protein B0H19DRAFT_1267133 [Mycena capillaripes]
MFRVINEQSQSKFDADFNWVSFHNLTGSPGSLSPPVKNAGAGESSAFTGMVGTYHRPSDDLSTLTFLTPANAMLSVELGHLADILTALGQSKTAQGKNVSEQATLWSKRTRDAIWNTTASFISLSSFIH